MKIHCNCENSIRKRRNESGESSVITSIHTETTTKTAATTTTTTNSDDDVDWPTNRLKKEEAKGIKAILNWCLCARERSERERNYDIPNFEKTHSVLYLFIVLLTFACYSSNKRKLFGRQKSSDRAAPKKKICNEWKQLRKTHKKLWKKFIQMECTRARIHAFICAYQ